MLAFERTGAGEPLVLLHGTNSSRAVWDLLLPELAAQRDVIAVDLPGHGDSPPTSLTPPGFARDLAGLFDTLGVDAPAVVGHSVGGWTALELAREGRAGAVLALMPAGLWRRHSPRLTDLNLQLSWRLGRAFAPVAGRALRRRPVRVAGLRSVSARPGAVPHAVAVSAARIAAASEHFPEHFRQTRVLRFQGGDRIPPEVPVRVVWGSDDRIALPGKSRWEDELPSHAVVEAWPDCGHMALWDQAEQTVEAILATRVAPDRSDVA